MTVGAMGMDDNAIVVDQRDSFAIVKFNQPKLRNPLSIAVLEELDKTFSALIQSKAITAIIFTGTANVFASGANIRELAALTPSQAFAFAKLGQGVFERIARAEQTTIAAINGYCFGGGLDLALACDIRCASASAMFAHPGAQLGIITGWGGTQRLPRVVGMARALEMFTTARRVTSTEALDFGLITRIGDPVLNCALELAR
jgi:enoyl-CoA hydratase/carnithine racemase